VVVKTAVSSSAGATNSIQTAAIAVTAGKVGIGGGGGGGVERLTDSLLAVAVSIAGMLGAESSPTALASHDIFLPDTNGYLALAITLVNDDVPWMSGPEFTSMRTGCRLVHANISSKYVVHTML
jgi:hypothetical protein